MEKGADTRTLSVEFFENCENFGLMKIIYSYFGAKPPKLWKWLLAYQIFCMFVAYKRWFPPYFLLSLENLIKAFAEIWIVKTTCQRKDWNFFHVCIACNAAPPAKSILDTRGPKKANGLKDKRGYWTLQSTFMAYSFLICNSFYKKSKIAARGHKMANGVW